MPKDSIRTDKIEATDFTGDISRTLNDAMVTSMAECFAIQQGIMNVPIFNGKNMPVRDFIRDVTLTQAQHLGQSFAIKNILLVNRVEIEVSNDTA